MCLPDPSDLPGLRRIASEKSARRDDLPRGAFWGAVERKIWLTTQDGTMYALDDESAKPIILPAFVRNLIVDYRNRIWEMGKQPPNWTGAYVRWSDRKSEGENFETLSPKSYDAR